MSDPYQAAQDAAELHLSACNAALWSDEFDGIPDGHDDVIPDSPAVAPFCGCDTCLVREVLHAALPFMAAIVAAEAEDAVFRAALVKAVEKGE